MSVSDYSYRNAIDILSIRPGDIMQNVQSRGAKDTGGILVHVALRIVLVHITREHRLVFVEQSAYHESIPSDFAYAPRWLALRFCDRDMT